MRTTSSRRSAGTRGKDVGDQVALRLDHDSGATGCHVLADQVQWRPRSDPSTSSATGRSRPGYVERPSIRPVEETALEGATRGVRKPDRHAAASSYSWMRPPSR